MRTGVKKVTFHNLSGDLIDRLCFGDPVYPFSIIIIAAASKVNANVVAAVVVVIIIVVHGFEILLFHNTLSLWLYIHFINLL